MKKILIISFICFLSTIFTGCKESTINQYTITFNSNGGTEVSSIIQDYNTQITKPDDPTKTGYIFDGWYKDSDLTQVYAFTTMPKENITLYAKWIELSSEGLSYTLLGDNTCSVSGYSGSNPNVLIPRVYNGCLVTTIADSTFKQASSITSITISNSIITIGEFAFAKTTNLTKVIFEEGSQLTTIGNYAFSFATSLKSIIIPNSVTIIGDLAFACATSLTTVIFEEGSQLTTIEEGTFSETTSLTSITIPNSVTTIGDSAFAYATSLTSIIIPNSVTTIGDSAFTSTISLTTVIFEEGSQLTTIGDGAFWRATSLINIIIPNNVTTIGDFAFYEATSLTGITISNNVTRIGDFAFRGTASLTSINVDDDNPEYSSKDGVLLNKSQTLIISYPADKNEATYKIPDGVTTISRYAFEGAIRLTNITIPDSVITISSSAFRGATRLTSITIPISVTTIGVSAFKEATSLTSINVDDDNPLYSSKEGVLFNKDQTLIISYPAGKNETTYIIPDGVTTIGGSAFVGATNLTSITIPDSVTEIGYSAFARITGLTSIIIPNSVTTIGRYAFDESTNLTSIIITDEKPPSIFDFGITNDNLKIYVPSDYVSIYKSTWLNYASIIYPIDN